MREGGITVPRAIVYNVCVCAVAGLGAKINDRRE